MFGKNGGFNAGEKVDTLVGKDTKFKGSLEANGTVRIDGYLEGEIAAAGDLLIGESGVLKANLKTRNCTIAGEVYGDIVAEQKIEISSSGKVCGNIKGENLVIGEGAVFHGKCEMKRSGLNIAEAAASKQKD